MAQNFEFTNKTQESLAEAIQLAKDYANAQSTLLPFRHKKPNLMFLFQFNHRILLLSSSMKV